MDEQYNDWSADVIAIGTANRDLLDALNRQDYDAAIELATTIVVCGRAVAIRARMLKTEDAVNPLYFEGKNDV